MTDAAVTQGTFADFRLIKGRKVCQIVIEVPIEQADQALAALGGLPQPATEAWVAVARLNNGPLRPTKPVDIKGEGNFLTVQQSRKSDTKLGFEAVKRCRDPLFQRYLGVSNEDEAAEAVRKECGISSRAGLNTDPEAASLWRTLDGQFLAWKRAVA